MRTLAIIAALISLSLSACEPASEADSGSVAQSQTSSPLEGAWRLAEVTSADTASAARVDEPGLFIFSPTHYSMMRVIGEMPRATFAAVDPTDAEKLTAYDTFIANSGTYQISGNTITTTPIVSKHPNFMNGGRDEFQFRAAGDTLWLTSSGRDLRFIIGGQLVPASGEPVETTFKLVRAQ
jgi:hypothetical protein